MTNPYHALFLKNWQIPRASIYRGTQECHLLTTWSNNKNEIMKSLSHCQEVVVIVFFLKGEGDVYCELLIWSRFWTLSMSLWSYCLEDHHPVVLKASQSDPHQGPPQTLREPNRTGIPLSSTTRGPLSLTTELRQTQSTCSKKCSLSTFWLLACLAYVIVDLSFYSYCEYRSEHHLSNRRTY